MEWNAVFGLLKARKVGEVMLTRFGRVEGKGLHGLAGYTDLDLTPDQAAQKTPRPDLDLALRRKKEMER